MKNPAKPGDFGTNGTQGVVGSGMSETTKRAIPTDLMDLGVPWCKRIDPTHLAARSIDQRALRASRFAVEVGAGSFTPTRSGERGTASEEQMSRADERRGSEGEEVWHPRVVSHKLNVAQRPRAATSRPCNS